MNIKVETKSIQMKTLLHYILLTLLETTLRKLAQKGDSKRTRIYCNLGSYFRQECHWYLSKRGVVDKRRRQSGEGGVPYLPGVKEMPGKSKSKSKKKKKLSFFLSNRVLLFPSIFIAISFHF